jgi:hypothetical protein
MNDLYNDDPSERKLKRLRRQQRNNKDKIHDSDLDDWDEEEDLPKNKRHRKHAG